MTDTWHRPDTIWLPPKDARLIGPDDKIVTPVDERGLIDIDLLIDTVNSTVDPSYEWPDYLSVHHFFWEEYKFPNIQSASNNQNPHHFYDLPIHKGLVPRVFENWLHLITLEPPVPDKEVMSYRVEAWEVVNALFRKARQVVQQERRYKRRLHSIDAGIIGLRDEFDGVDVIGREIINQVLEKHFSGLAMHVERNQQLPPEFRLIDFETPQEVIGTNLGKIAGRPHLDYRRRVRQAA